MKTIYIAGRGHSGSTFLDVVLGHSGEVESVGEILSGLNRGSSEICSCGSELSDCLYWQRVGSRYQAGTGRSLIEDGRWLYAKSDIRDFLYYFLGFRANVKNLYGERSDSIFEAVAEVSGKNILVDSNKEYTRGLLLLATNQDTCLIHLYRDPVKLAASHFYRQRKGIPFKFLKRQVKASRLLQLLIIPFIGFTWSVGMFIALLINIRFGSRVVNVSYEKFCEDPTGELRRIEKFTGVSLEQSIAAIENEETIPVGHNLGGNELRHEGGFKFVANSSGRRDMPMFYRVLVLINALPGLLISRLLPDHG